MKSRPSNGFDQLSELEVRWFPQLRSLEGSGQTTAEPLPRDETDALELSLNAVLLKPGEM
jgi:hypothetical protein